MIQQITIDMEADETQTFVVPKQDHDEMCIHVSREKDVLYITLKYPKGVLKPNEEKTQQDENESI